MAIIGIDLGTTKSVVSIFENGEGKVHPNQDGQRTTPSYVALKKDGEWLVGMPAKNQTAKNPKNTLYGIKRLIGRRFDDPIVAQMAKLASYKIVEGKGGDAWVEINGEAMSPQEVGAKILTKLKEAAEARLGEPVTEAVITVPAFFNDAQREATRQAGEIAGLKVRRIINEPTAAAMAYGLDKKKGGKFAVFDFGGGTFDISILEVSVSDEGNVIQTLSTNGDTFLGGENIDELLTEHLINRLKAKCKEDSIDFDIDLSDTKSRQDNAATLQRIREAAENAKIALSSVGIDGSVQISVPYISAEIHLDETLTRREFEKLARPIIEKTIAPCKQSLADAGLSLSDLDEVILVGQSTRIPLVKELVKDFFKKEPKCDVPLDEIVAVGASVQGAVLDGKVDNIVLVDVIPLSIGIRTSGDIMDVVVPANTAIPHEAKQVYSNSEDNQPNVAIMIYQGERPKASDNKFMGKMTLELPVSRLKPVKAGEAQIEVTFAIDENGTLSLSAKDLKSGKEAKATFKANGGLTEEEVEQMRADAAKNAEADKAFREARETEIAAKYALSEAAEDEKDPSFAEAPAELRQQFSDVVKELTESVAKKDTAAQKRGLERLTEARSAFAKHFETAASAGNTDAAADKPQAPESAAKDKAPKGPEL